MVNKLTVRWEQQGSLKPLVQYTQMQAKARGTGKQHSIERTDCRIACRQDRKWTRIFEKAIRRQGISPEVV
jgi:hypothetical protein